MPESLITAAEFDEACLAAREFNEYVPPDRARTATACPSDAKGDRPGDEFNRRAAWQSILEPHGWTVARAAGDVTYWTRPGKRAGVSATTGRCKSDASGDLLYVFTSNAPPFEPDVAYDKFGAVTHLEHAGDFAAAAKKLRAEGYTAAEPVAVFSEPDVAAGADDDVAGIEDLKKVGAQIRWVWHGWIQKGVVTAVAAQGGTGKTRLMADLVRRVRHGLPWPDMTPMEIRPGKTVALWVASDNHHDEMVTLSEAFGIADCVKLNASKSDPYGGVTLEVVEDFADLERRIKATRPVFVIVDTVGNATDKNLSRQEDAKAFYQPLQLIARRQSVAVVALTHLNAGGKVLGRRVLEKVRVCLRMNAPEADQNAKRRLEVFKSNSQKPAPLGVVMKGDGNDYDNDPPPKPEDEGNPRPVIGEKAAESGPKTKVEQCMNWIDDMITNKLVSKVADLNRMRDKSVFHDETFKRAVKRLGLEVFQQPGTGDRYLRYPLNDKDSDGGEITTHKAADSQGCGPGVSCELPDVPPGPSGVSVGGINGTDSIIDTEVVA